MLQVCAGLHAAHAEGVIHRDLKPSNIMRDQAGRVVIMDFGLARTVEGDGMTQTGMMIGTMEYMSPEQAMGKELDARSDQFAIGLIFYELLSGSIPFHAESAIASLVKRTQERAVPLVEIDAAIPPALSEIVGKCLERDPAARFSSVEELAAELENWQGKRPRSSYASVSRPGIPAPVAGKAFPWKWLAIGIAAVLLGIGAVVGVRSRAHPGGEAGATQGPVTSLAILPFYNASGDSSLNLDGIEHCGNVKHRCGTVEASAAGLCRSSAAGTERPAGFAAIADRHADGEAHCRLRSRRYRGLRPVREDR